MTWHPLLARNEPRKRKYVSRKEIGGDDTNLLSNFLILEDNHFVRLVTSTVQICQNLQCFVFSINLRKVQWMLAISCYLQAMVHQITRTLRENEHPKTQNDGRYHLQAPWNTEGGNAVDIRASKLNEVLN
jgi:hypothetical protein